LGPDRHGDQLDVHCMARRVSPWLLALLLPAAAGCGKAAYLSHVTKSELKILLSRRDLQSAQTSDQFTTEQRRKLALIRRAADFAEGLGLARDDQYTTVAMLPQDFTLYVLTVAEPDEVTAVTWSFPIAGEVPYLGFFERELVVEKANMFAEEGKDTYIRTAAAFSTLGYLPDPVLPGFLRLPEDAVVETVMHELVHATIYAPGQSDWNETVATGLAAAELALKAWERDDLLADLRARRQDRFDWARMVTAAIDDLKQRYRQLGDDRHARLAYKRGRLDALAQTIAAHPWRIGRYARFAELDLNHAFLIANQIYAADPELQARWLAAARQNFAAVLTGLKQRADRPDAEQLWAPLPGE